MEILKKYLVIVSFERKLFFEKKQHPIVGFFSCKSM